MGVGISGATCARLLSDRYKITIIDKNDFLGGNCYDYLSEDGSCYIHRFGPHIFHTLNKEVWDFVNCFAKFNSYVHCVYTQVGDTVYSFPINLDVLSKLYKCKIYSKEEADRLIHDCYFDNPENFE